MTFLATLDEDAFRQFFSGSPIKRIGRNRFLRNVLLAMGNSNFVTFVPVVKQKLAEEDPVVRGAAVWTLSRLLSAQDFEALAIRALQTEVDPDVLDEWMQGGEEVAQRRAIEGFEA